MSLTAILEVISGAMSIATGLFALHLIAHIFTAHTWHDIYRKRSLGLEIAVGLLITTFGWFGRSFIIWWWRASASDHALKPDLINQSGWLVVSTALALVGYICLIRVFTRVTYGHWPWVSAVIILGVYAVFALS